MKAEVGHVTYGGRAFHQDATEAMAGDIVRGLLETITNSDDSYSDKAGKIRIEVEHRRNDTWKVITRDRASGMTTAQMRKGILDLAEELPDSREGRASEGI